MTMATRVYQDENHKYQFDFSAALWATGELHEKYKTVGNRLYDVDFLVETKKEIFLIEYKNANIPGAAKPEAFDPMEQGRLKKRLLAIRSGWFIKEYRISMIYLIAGKLQIGLPA